MLTRPAVEADKPAINELRRQVKLLHAAGKPEVFTEGFPQELADYLNTFFLQENGEVVGTEREGKIVGFACINYVERPASIYRHALKYCEIEEIGVDEHCRRQGVGKALVEFVRARAAEKGFSRLDLNMWEFNENALRFYEAIDFRTYRRYMELG